MARIARLFTVDVEVYEEARRKGINLSEAAELGLRSVIRMEDVREKAKKYSVAMQKLLREITDEDMRKCQEAIKRDTQFSIGWRRIFKNKYECDVTREEINKVFG